MADAYIRRRAGVAGILLTILIFVLVNYYSQPAQPLEVAPSVPRSSEVTSQTTLASEALQTLAVKGRASKTDYSRAQFGDGWASVGGCDMRNIILNRDLMDAEIDSECNVIKGLLNDPYTGKIVQFERGNDTSSAVQIDHAVALSDAWQKGAQQLSKQARIELANDPLELLAVDGPTNQKKADGDAATWLPPNKAFRCQYVARQIAVKQKYSLWVTPAERDAMKAVLSGCALQALPTK